MKLYKTFISACLVALLIVLAGSCRKGQSGWNTELLVPIVSTNLSLQNLVSDSTITANKDSSLTLAFQSTLYQFTLASKIVQIPDTAIGQKFNVDSLQLPNIRINFITSLGSIANQIGPPLGPYIISLDSTTNTVPALSLTNAFAPFNFDASNYFDSAYLSTGQAQIWAINGLPVNIAAGTTCILRDSVTHVILDTAVFPEIPAMDSAFVVFNLKPGLITSHLQFTIGTLNTEASNGAVFIDTADKITLRFFIGYLHVSQAWAIFPNQSVVDQTNDITFSLADRKFTFIDATSGSLHVKIYNSVPQPLTLQYTLVGAFDKSGHPLVKTTRVNQAVGNTPGIVDDTLDVSGYSINLTGKNGTSFNTYTQRIVCNLDSTGQTQHITLQDSLNISYELINIKPNYVKGYLGRDTITTADSSAFTFLSMFKSGTLNLQNVNMNFSVDNSIGVDGQVTVNSLTAESATNPSQSLNLSRLHQPFTVNPATDFPLTPAISNFALNNNNSNINQLLDILPNKLAYNVLVQTNVHGNNNQYREFAYLQNGMSVNLNAEIPLSFIANNLVLVDTIAFNLANTNTNVNGISDGVINIIAENMYPIQSVLNVIVYDANWHPVDTLALNQLIMAANTNASCRAYQPTQTVFQEYADNAHINKLKQGVRAIVTANFSTTARNATCNGQYFKIYSNYSIGITLSARFNYQVNTKL